MSSDNNEAQLILNDNVIDFFVNYVINNKEDESKFIPFALETKEHLYKISIKKIT